MSDQERHKRRTEWQTVAGGFALMVVVGGALLWLIYGQTVALIGIGVAAIGIAIFGLLWALLRLLETWAKSE